MKYEFPKEPPVGSKLLCTSRTGSKYVYVSHSVPDHLLKAYGPRIRYLMEGMYFDDSIGHTWKNLLGSFETVEDYVDEDAEFRKELASIICGFNIDMLNSENQKFVDEGMKIVMQKVREYDAKKKED